jgi:uncharacterized OsmC-like protein
MKHLLSEPVELTEVELDAVAGGNPFAIGPVTLTAAGIASSVSATITTSFANAPATAIMASVDNAVTISGP